MAEPFQFELVSPEALLLSEEASEVVVPGSEGYFTVMANHAPLMSTLKPGVVEVKLASGDSKQIFVRGGFADVSPSGFTLLAEYSVPLEDLDMAELDQEIQNAQEDVNDADSDEKRAKAELLLGQLETCRDAINASRH